VRPDPTELLTRFRALAGEHALLATVKHFLQLFGGPQASSQLPTPQEAFSSYCISRQIHAQGGSRLMPVLELINHANGGAPESAASVLCGTGQPGRSPTQIQENAP